MPRSNPPMWTHAGLVARLGQPVLTLLDINSLHATWLKYQNDEFIRVTKAGRPGGPFIDVPSEFWDDIEQWKSFIRMLEAQCEKAR